ncbi:MAG: hypothetical protein JO281_12210 [Pseudonocardiales bacterium]|nr:hypothetical protein [Pseudonocardiales bacterium]
MKVPTDHRRTVPAHHLAAHGAAGRFVVGVQRRIRDFAMPTGVLATSAISRAVSPGYGGHDPGPFRRKGSGRASPLRRRHLGPTSSRADVIISGRRLSGPRTTF